MIWYKGEGGVHTGTPNQFTSQFATGSAHSYRKWFSANRFSPNSHVSWNCLAIVWKSKTIRELLRQPRCMDTERKWRFLAWCNSAIFAHTTKIISVLDWWVCNRMWPKPVPHEQCEHELFLETSSLNWFRQTGSKTVAVWTPWLRDGTKPSNFMHAHTICNVQTHAQRHAHTLTHTHTPPVLEACCVREAGLSVAPDSKEGCAATTEGTAVEWGTQGEGQYGNCYSCASVWRRS